MRLESLTVELRPRSNWEAMELGNALVRRHAAAIWKPWVLMTLPLFAVINIAFWAIGAAWAAWLVMWWLRPLFDRIPLYVLSRAVFGTVPTTRETLRAQSYWGLRKMLSHLTWRRLSPLRTAMLPIDLLEGADAAVLRVRRQTLGTGLGGHAVLLTAICANFIPVLQLSLLLLVLLFVPNEWVPDMARHLWGMVNSQVPPVWMFLLLNLADYVAMSIIEPFYVGGGFWLYLNRRTQLEAWDVEIAFRRMRKRLDASSLVLMLALMLLWPALSPAQTALAQQQNAASTPTPVNEKSANQQTLKQQTLNQQTAKQQDTADDDRSAEDASNNKTANQQEQTSSDHQHTGDAAADAADAAAAAATKATGKYQRAEGVPPRELNAIFGEDTADHRGFGKSVGKAYTDPLLRPKLSKTTWEPRDKKAPEKAKANNAPQLEWLAEILGFIGEYGMWCLLGVLLLVLLLTAKRWLPWLGRFVGPEPLEAAPVEMQAMPHAEPLPPDIATVARRLWREGQPRRALALLYRASVEAMTARANLHLPPGATEAECLRVSRRMPDAEDRTIFQHVVRVWQYAAYGQRLPEEADFDAMVDTLAQRFGWTS